MPSCFALSAIRYRSRVSGVVPGKEWRPPVHLSVVVVEKKAYGSPSTTVSQLT